MGILKISGKEEEMPAAFPGIFHLPVRRTCGNALTTGAPARIPPEPG